MWGCGGHGETFQGRASEPPQGLCDPFGNELSSLNKPKSTTRGTPRPFWAGRSPLFFSQTFLYFATSSFPKTELVLLPPLKNLLEPCGLACYTWLCCQTPAFISSPFIPASQYAATFLPLQTSDCPPNMPGLFHISLFLIENHGNFNPFPVSWQNPIHS